MIVDKIVLRYNVMSAFSAASRIADFFRAHCVSFDAMTILPGSQQQQQHASGPKVTRIYIILDAAYRRLMVLLAKVGIKIKNCQ
jgi:hypothetical protein